MRASDDLRESTVSRLGAGYSQGLLGFDTLCRRVDGAYAARTIDQLRALVTDLPEIQTLRRRLRRWLRSLTDARDEVVPLLRPPRVGEGRALLIGRAGSCDLVVPSQTVSRQHARLELLGDRWQLSDLGSMNGTQVNGWRVREPVELEPGDAITLGDRDWVFAPH